VRDIVLIHGQKKVRALFLINDEYPVLYEAGGKVKDKK